MTVPNALLWRVLHSYVVDAVVHQEPEVADDIVALMGGLTLQAFHEACFTTGFARVRSDIREDQLIYRVEVKADDGYLTLTRPTAAALGIEDTPELRDREISINAERLFERLTGEDEQ